MFNLLRNVKYLTEKKVRNPFFATYFFVLLYRNWALIFTLFNFDNDCSLNDKLYLIHKQYENVYLLSEIWTNLWITALVIVISYLLYFGFRVLANFFERKVFPIADKIDDALVVTKERHLKVKEDRDSLNKELEKLRDDNIRHGKDYANLEKKITEDEKAKNDVIVDALKLRTESTMSEAKIKDLVKSKDVLISDNNIIKKERNHLLDSLVKQVELSLKKLKDEKKYDLFLSDFPDTSNKHLEWFNNVGLLYVSYNGAIKTTLLGSVLNFYLLQDNFNNSQKINIYECATIVLKDYHSF